MKKKVFIREELCMNCTLCSVYCKQEHSMTKDIIKAYKKEKPTPMARIRMERKGPVTFTVRCQHCEDAPCVKACITGAMTQNAETGVVLVNPEKCIGCWTCIMACPYGAIKRDKEMGIASKCDLCQGRAIPACVEGCPNVALFYTEV